MTLATTSVLLPMPLPTCFDYRLEGELATTPPPLGSYVVVPFGPRRVVGVVWERGSARPVAEARLKPVQAVLGQPPLPAPLRRLVEAVARATVTPMGSVLRLVLSTPAAFEAEPARIVLVPTGAAVPLSAKQQLVLAAFATGGPQPAAALARAAGVSAGVVKTLVDKGVLRSETVAQGLPDPPCYQPPDPARLGYVFWQQRRALHQYYH